MTPMRAKSWLIVACLFCTSPRLHAAETAGSAAVNPQDLDLAERHHAEALQAFEAERFAAAEIEFAAAYQLSKRVDILHNMSVTAEKLGKVGEAIRLEEEYVRLAPVPAPREQDEIRGRLARLREALPKPPVAAVQPQVKPSAPLALEQADGRSRRADTAQRKNIGGAVLVGLGGALVGIGIGCGVGAFATARTLEGQPFTLGEIDALTQRGQALDRAGIGLDVVGGLALGAGAAWLVWDKLHRKTPIALVGRGLQLVR